MYVRVRVGLADDVTTTTAHIQANLVFDLLEFLDYSSCRVVSGKQQQQQSVAVS